MKVSVSEFTLRARDATTSKKFKKTKLALKLDFTQEFMCAGRFSGVINYHRSLIAEDTDSKQSIAVIWLIQLLIDLTKMSPRPRPGP